jgi:hypothetical protein
MSGRKTISTLGFPFPKVSISHAGLTLLQDANWSGRNLHAMSAIYQYPKAGAGTHCIGYGGYMRGAITG